MKTISKMRALSGLYATASGLVLASAMATPAAAQTVINDGDNVTVASQNDGEMISVAAGAASEVDGAPVVIFDNNNVTLNNPDGVLRTLGVANTIQINADAMGGTVNNGVLGLLEADSRVVDIQGDGFTLNNQGEIIGTDDQRNGAVYVNRTATDFTINNTGLTALIDAGEGNNGAGVSVEVGGGGAPITGSIVNEGEIIGRGQAAANLSTAGDGVRFFGPGLAPSYEFSGDIINSGLISSESTQGPTAGVRFSNNIGFTGTLTNEEGGVIEGVNNGLYFGDANHDDGVVDNFGEISSDSRALNIDGEGLDINNFGDIVGTGDQRNGTVYADSTAQDFTLTNDALGLIDAGAGNQGAGFSVELSQAGNDFTINNAGDILGRGQAAAGLATAGDGLRFERERVGGMLDGSTTGLFTGDIINSGVISSESAQGTAGGIRFVNGVSFNGTIDNSGSITGVQNGLYFGNATPAGGGDFTGAVVNNSGVISSDSRALNIDGLGLEVNNSGQILGTGDQRNGTVYADSTAQDFTLNNLVGGVIDAGAGNNGAGFSVELSQAGNDFTINNAGDILGRGQAAAGLATAGDGLRFERERVGGMLDGSTTGLFTGDIINSGVISSESAQGTAGGIRFVNGVSFNGTIDNSGSITGVQNGLYFGNATPAGGGDFTGAVVNNSGVISSDSRALNIDGLGLEVNNAGQILGTGDQRNGTVYADATANAYVFNNLASGVVDVGEGNNGSAVSLQSGNVDGETVTFTLNNAGVIRGRGDALASGAAAGLRVFGGAENVAVNGSIANSGEITSETAAAILIENVNFTGSISNGGVLTGASAFDASSALGGVTFTQNGGALNGDFIGSAFADQLTVSSGAAQLNGSVRGGVDLSVAQGAELTIIGVRTLDGDLSTDGALNFRLGADSLTVDGDLVFGEGSVVTIQTPTDLLQLTLDAPIEVVRETGAFTDNGVTVNIDEDDFLIDYTVALGGVTVTPTAADLTAVSADANISAFGGAVAGALTNGALDAQVAAFLNGSQDASAFETNVLSLLPAINEAATREIYETQDLANAAIHNRLRGEGRGLWGQFLYRTADRDAESLSVSGYDADAFGFAVGYDAPLSQALRAGLSFSYANIDIDADGGQQSDIDALQVSAYAGYQQGQWFANGVVGYSFNSVDTTRTSTLGAIASEYDVNGFNLEGVLGYDLVSGKARVAPTLGVQYGRLSSDEFTESGALGLSIDPEAVDFLDLKLGVEASTAVSKGAWELRPLARAAYVYDAIGDEAVFNTSFSGQTVALRSVAPAQSRFEFGAGLELAQKSGVALSLEYDGELADGYTAHGGFFRARVSF